MNRGSGSNWLRIITVAICMSASPFTVYAQNSYEDGDEINSYSQGELSQLLAPIALYPDQLVGQILMASTYPLDVVEAQRWLEIPQNAGLRGNQLEAALEQQDWDPSVKSLVQFPQIISMLDKNIKWTQSLGDAFLDDEDGVMDTIQQLRAQAQVTGALAPSAQQNVTMDNNDIIIQPTNPQTIYIPSYNPSVVYGNWAYPQYPPYYFPSASGVYSNSYISYGAAVSVIPLYWGWNRWDWRNHRIHIDNDHFRRINRNRAPVFVDTWRHDPGHRGGIPYHRNRVNYTETHVTNPAVNFAKPRRNHNNADPQATPSVAATPQVIYGTSRKTMTPQVPPSPILQAAPEKPMQQAVPLNPAPVVATPPANNENHRREHRERHSGRGFQAVTDNTQNPPVVNKETTSPQRHGEGNKHHEGEREHRRDNRSNNADNPANDNAPKMQK